MLCNAGADVNLTSKSGVNALFLTIKTNNIECIKYLLTKKAAIHLKEPAHSEHSPIFYSIKACNKDALIAILDSVSPLEGIESYTNA